MPHEYSSNAEETTVFTEAFLNFTEKYNMSFPGWEPERKDEIKELFEKFSNKKRNPTF